MGKLVVGKAGSDVINISTNKDMQLIRQSEPDVLFRVNFARAVFFFFIKTLLFKIYPSDTVQTTKTDNY